MDPIQRAVSQTVKVRGLTPKTERKRPVRKRVPSSFSLQTTDLAAKKRRYRWGRLHPVVIAPVESNEDRGRKFNIEARRVRQAKIDQRRATPIRPMFAA